VRQKAYLEEGFWGWPAGHRQGRTDVKNAKSAQVRPQLLLRGMGRGGIKSQTDNGQIRRDSAGLWEKEDGKRSENSIAFEGIVTEVEEGHTMRD